MKFDINKINIIRITQGLSITQLAEKSQLSKATISRILGEKTNARANNIGKIAKALDVGIEQITVSDES
ncbi:helix-turn-helix protein [compost metagenome]|uniref:Helix-turn-helix transcriptional regulator n=1 Tax=Clostridium intestinale TaxID=36845 RepID=A0A7D6W2I2_9CLOT|nr:MULTISPECIES: helix-turn-helix transcriptional regulator [Clostridium]QLY81205.1 helix-turn-helix transcriptional regulator [Clostridium intestinale]